MKDNYQEKYNMDRDLIWEAYGVVNEQPNVQTDEIGSPDHPVLRQARSIFQNGVGTTPEALAAQVAAVQNAQATLSADMTRIKEEMRKQDRGAASNFGAAPQQEQLQNTWKKAVAAYTELRQMAGALGQAGADTSALMEAFNTLSNIIVEFNNIYGLVEQVDGEDEEEDDSWEAYDKENEEEIEEESHDCDKDHPDESHEDWEGKNVKQENCGDVPMPDEEPHDISNMDLSDLEIDRISDGDTEGRMAKKDLYKLAKYASQLHNMIEDGEELEPWVQAKVAKAADYIGAVFHYMDYDEDRDEDREHQRVELSDLEDELEKLS